MCGASRARNSRFSSAGLFRESREADSGFRRGVFPSGVVFFRRMRRPYSIFPWYHIRQISELSEFFLPQFHDPEHAGECIGIVLQDLDQMRKPSLPDQHPVKTKTLRERLASLKRNPTGGIQKHPDRLSILVCELFQFLRLALPAFPFLRDLFGKRFRHPVIPQELRTGLRRLPGRTIFQ